MQIGEPRLVDRPEQHYVGVRRRVTMPFDDVVPVAMDKLFDEMKARGIEAVGPVFFKYNFINMPELELDFAAPVAGSVSPGANLVLGTLPAGRYAELTALGHYDRLIEANAALIDWARNNGIPFDVDETPEGDWFAGRMEIYLNSPEEEPNSDKWETIVSIRLRDSTTGQPPKS